MTRKVSPTGSLNHNRNNSLFLAACSIAMKTCKNLTQPPFSHELIPLSTGGPAPGEGEGARPRCCCCRSLSRLAVGCPPQTPGRVPERQLSCWNGTGGGMEGGGGWDAELVRDSQPSLTQTFPGQRRGPGGAVPTPRRDRGGGGAYSLIGGGRVERNGHLLFLVLRPVQRVSLVHCPQPPGQRGRRRRQRGEAGIGSWPRAQLQQSQNRAQSRPARGAAADQEGARRLQRPAAAHGGAVPRLPGCGGGGARHPGRSTRAALLTRGLGRHHVEPRPPSAGRLTPGRRRQRGSGPLPPPRPAPAGSGAGTRPKLPGGDGPGTMPGWAGAGPLRRAPRGCLGPRPPQGSAARPGSSAPARHFRACAGGAAPAGLCGTGREGERGRAGQGNKGLVPRP